jgi:hypothetical protein
MPKVKAQRKPPTNPTPAGPVRPAPIEALLCKLDGLLERLAVEGTKCAEAQNDPSLPRVALLAARWIVTLRLWELEMTAKGARFAPGQTPWRVDSSWFRAAAAAAAPVSLSTSAPRDPEGDDPLAHIAEEIATYRAHLQEMAREHTDEFVLIKGKEIIGFFPDYTSAIQEGYRRFGRAPFLVKEVTFPERVVYIPNVVP